MNNTLELEWHPKNEKPFSAYTDGSNFKAWWLCSTCQHEWQATINNRAGSRKSKCPNCRKTNARGNKNPRWSGHGEISGAQWCKLKNESTLQFEITIEYAWNLFLEQNRKCALSGEPLTMWGKINGKYQGTASLDRIDSSKGYVEGNVQWVDKKIQQMKRNMLDGDFIDVCEKVARYQKKKGIKLPIPSFKEYMSLPV